MPSPFPLSESDIVPNASIRAKLCSKTVRTITSVSGKVVTMTKHMGDGSSGLTSMNIDDVLEHWERAAIEQVD